MHLLLDILPLFRSAASNPLSFQVCVAKVRPHNKNNAQGHHDGQGE
jgi:hypothetical protein